MARLRAVVVFKPPIQTEAANGRSDFSGAGGRAVFGFRRLRHGVEARLTMLVSVLWGAGAIVVAVYMVAALLRPDKF